MKTCLAFLFAFAICCNAMAQCSGGQCAARQSLGAPQGIGLSAAQQQQRSQIIVMQQRNAQLEQQIQELQRQISELAVTRQQRSGDVISSNNLRSPNSGGGRIVTLQQRQGARLKSPVTNVVASRGIQW